LDVVDRHNLIVFIDDLGRNLAGDDAFKQRHRLEQKDSVATGPCGRAEVWGRFTSGASSANALKAMHGFYLGLFQNGI
jgi:hypothetical protein